MTIHSKARMLAALAFAVATVACSAEGPSSSSDNDTATPGEVYDSCSQIPLTCGGAAVGSVLSGAACSTCAAGGWVVGAPCAACVAGILGSGAGAQSCINQVCQCVASKGGACPNLFDNGGGAAAPPNCAGLGGGIWDSGAQQESALNQCSVCCAQNVNSNCTTCSEWSYPGPPFPPTGVCVAYTFNTSNPGCLPSSNPSTVSPGSSYQSYNACINGCLSSPQVGTTTGVAN
jgi:hypothetical protein